MDVILNEIEARVIGSMVEKKLTTPDYYPLTLNAFRALTEIRGVFSGLAACDPGMVTMAARGTAELLERIRRLDDVLTDAAAVDPDAAALRKDIELRQRREAMRVLAGWLASTAPLRDGMTVERAADVLWVLTSPEVHRLYREHCAHCHGISGDGVGPTAVFLNPYPRARHH